MIICYHVRLCSVVRILFSISSDSRSHGISRRYSSSFLKQSAKLQKSCGIPPSSFRIPCLRWHKSANYVLSWQIRLAEPLLGSAKFSKRLPPRVANCPPFLPLCLMANAGRCAFVSVPSCVRIWEQLRPCLEADALVSPPRCAEKNRGCGA